MFNNCVLYISNDEGVSNAYTNNATSVAHASVLINIEENTFYGISFDYKSVGEETCCDYVGVRLVPFGQDLGTSNTLSHMIDKSPYGTNNEWQRVNIEVPTSTTPGAYNLVFSWRNDSGAGENPPAAIDNVSIYTMACTSTAINSSWLETSIIILRSSEERASAINQSETASVIRMRYFT